MEEFEDSPLDEAFERTFEPEPEVKLREPDSPVVLEAPPLKPETQSLLYTGHLTSEVQIGNHRIDIRSLRIGEEFEAALLAKKYEETVEAGRALAAALVAAAITRVDGKPLVYEPLSDDDLTVEAKFKYLLDNWYWPPIQKVYQAYGALVREVSEAYENLGKA